MERPNLSLEAMELAKKVSIQVWAKYDDDFGYRSEKLAAMDNWNVNDPRNIWSFWGQFDSHNQEEFAQRLVRDFADAPGIGQLLPWVLTELDRTATAVANLRAQGIDL